MKTKLLLLILALPVMAFSSPRIVTSIAPIHSIASQITEGVTEPQLLVTPDRSPHDFQLTPNELRSLLSADLVIWVGDGVEGYMSKVSRRINDDAKLELVGRVGDLLPLRDHGHDHDGHSHGEADQHIWLSINKMQLVAQIIADRLIEIDPGNQVQYLENLQVVQRNLSELDRSLKAQLAAVAGSPYVVFHDAYQYFEQSYGLNSIAAVMSPDRAGSSLARQFALRKMLGEQNVSCVFSEPQFSNQQIQRLVGSSYQVAVLDPLGANVAPGVMNYQQTMQGLADSLVSCLGENK